MRKKIFALIVSLGLLAAPAVFAAAPVPTGAPNIPAGSSTTTPSNYRMPMSGSSYGRMPGAMNRRGATGVSGSGFAMARRGPGSRGFGILAGITGFITIVLVWAVLVLFIMALCMHLRRMRKWSREKYKDDSKTEVFK